MTREPVSVHSSLAGSIISGVETAVVEAEQTTQPLEVAPYHDRLFELFVTAHGAGYLHEDADQDLTADGLCRALASRWNLADAARQSMENRTNLASNELARMRALWSVMRMWMEWTYAWNRWHEFHADEVPDSVLADD